MGPVSFVTGLKMDFGVIANFLLFLGAFGIILFTIVITAYYVNRANSEFDALSDAIAKEVLK